MNILKHYGQKSSKTSLIKECNVLQMGHKNSLHSRFITNKSVNLISSHDDNHHEEEYCLQQRRLEEKK